MRIVDGRPFECKKCGLCCKWDGVVLLNAKDIERLVSRIGCDKATFFDEYTNMTEFGRRALNDKPGSSECVFLENDRCTIYEDRPQQCKDFPWKYDRRCPGFLDGTSEGRADMSKDYERIVRMVREKLAGSEVFSQKVDRSFYEDLLKNQRVASVTAKAVDEGIDPFLGDNTLKVASLDDLFSFDRVDKKHLIHKSNRDLWSIDTDKQGNVQITRLFDNSGSPIKG